MFTKDCNIKHITDLEKLDFNLYVPFWRGAVSTIVEDRGEIVWGVLWEIDINQMANLNRQEGVDKGWYIVKNVTVTTPDGRNIIAKTYQEPEVSVANQKNADIPRELPSNTYLEVIALGAIESDLPPEYIGFLFSFATNRKMASDEIRKHLDHPF